MFQLTEGQKDALRKAIEWYFSTDFNKKNIFVLAGYAGCGKTTLVKTLTEEILGLRKYNVLYTAYTGKAVNVLRTKGNLAHTVHKSFYNIYKNKSGKFSFKLKSSLPSLIELIVIDEMSMLNDKFLEDISSFGIPIIALGDPGQLPPIFGKNTYISVESNIDSMLTDIVRQDESSGILELASKARQGIPIKLGQYKKSKVINVSNIKNVEKYDIVLCWKNSTRRILNKIIRDNLGITNENPIKNDKLICLKNNYFHEVEYLDTTIIPVNGLNCLAIENSKISKLDNTILNIKYKPEFVKNNVFFESRCEKFYFDSYKNLEIDQETEFNIREEDEIDDIVHLDFGYALTVHKSQGSEWNNVLIIDEFQGSQDVYNKWLYTGITRAKETITIAK